MRLIDAEKFEVFNATCPIPNGIRSGKTAAYFYGEGCGKVLEAIYAAPTIDPESLRPTAHWIVTKTNVCGINRYECSSCGAVRYKASALHLNYCQDCGKRMVNEDEKHCT